MADLSSSGWIRVAADSILQLTQVSLAVYELLLTQSHNWLEFRWLDTSYSWLLPTANSSSGSWVRLKTDSILRLTMSCGWLEFRQLGTSYSWLHPTADSSSSSWIRLKADSILRLTTSCGWFYPVADLSLPAWLGLRLTYTLIYQVNLRTYSSKYIIFMVCFLSPDFSYHWFRLRLLFQEHWRSLKKLEEAWRTFKNLAATDSSCSRWFETATNRLPPKFWPRCPLIAQ